MEAESIKETSHRQGRETDWEDGIDSRIWQKELCNRFHWDNFGTILYEKPRLTCVRRGFEVTPTDILWS